MHHFYDTIVMNAQDEHATTSSAIGTLLSHSHNFIFLNTQLFHNELCAHLLAICVSLFLLHCTCPNLSIFYYLPVLILLFVWLSGCCLYPCLSVFLRECLPRLCLFLYPSASCNLSKFLFFSPISLLNFFSNLFYFTLFLSILFYSILSHSTLSFSSPFFNPICSFPHLLYSFLLFLFSSFPFSVLLTAQLVLLSPRRARVTAQPLLLTGDQMRNISQYSVSQN